MRRDLINPSRGFSYIPRSSFGGAKILVLNLIIEENCHHREHHHSELSISFLTRFPSYYLEDFHIYNHINSSEIHVFFSVF